MNVRKQAAVWMDMDAPMGMSCFAQLKQYRAIATRYDKTALSYQAMIDLATLKLWL